MFSFDKKSTFELIRTNFTSNIIEPPSEVLFDKVSNIPTIIFKYEKPVKNYSEKSYLKQ